MRYDVNIGIFDCIIFLGIFQGIFLSIFFLKNSKQEIKANLFQGLLLLFLSLNIFEELLNNTGYIVRMLPITNFSEPSNFTFSPLLFLYLRSFLYPESQSKNWFHFIPAFLWLIYMYFAFIQPNEMKYNSYIETKHPDWEYLEVTLKISDDPLGIRNYINQLTFVQFVVYLSASALLIYKKAKSLNQKLFNTTNKSIQITRNALLSFMFLFVIYLSTKLYFGMESDLGGKFIAAYISFMIFFTCWHVMQYSQYFNYPNSFLNFSAVKYEKSSLDESSKRRILQKINQQMENEKFYLNNLASLSSLAKIIREPVHHVSQVINEKMHLSFFELIAQYRIQESINIIKSHPKNVFTIEELSEQVGYNSKSSFNKAFKKITGKTPSEYRNSPY